MRYMQLRCGAVAMPFLVYHDRRSRPSSDLETCPGQPPHPWRVVTTGPGSSFLRIDISHFNHILSSHRLHRGNLLLHSFCMLPLLLLLFLLRVTYGQLDMLVPSRHD